MIGEFTKLGIEINGSHSFFKYGLYMADRSVGLPERQTNFVTVPGMNGYYDYSNIVEPYYGSRQLTYSFDILAGNAQKVEYLVNEIYAWAKTAVESKIYDDYDPDYYFIGSYVSGTFTPDGDLPEFGGIITLNFTAQPYRYNRETDEGVI